MAVTIRDVAQELQLSITTVSRALDGYDDVAEETRQRVQQMAHKMGYVPNRAARQLRRQRTDTIGYILPSQKPQFFDPFFTDFIAGLGDETAHNNFDLLVSSAPPGDESEKSLYQRWVQGHKVDGIILNRMRLNDWRVQYLAAQKIPFATLERSLDSFDYPSVEVDGLAGVRKLVRFLVEQGHRRIGFAGSNPDLRIQVDRFAGYQQGLMDAGLKFDPHLVAQGSLTHQGGFLAGKELLELSNRPSAIVSVNDQMAIGVMQAARERGLLVGKDLAVAGFDGIAESAYTVPPLTTLNQPVYDLARHLVRILIVEISGEPLAEKRHRIEPELILRESTGPRQHSELL